MNYNDCFAQKLLEERARQRVTQRVLADDLSMCTRTIMDIENCKSSPKFETVALIARRMGISLDSIVFHDRVPQTVPKCVEEFFIGKSEEESQRFIALCRQIEDLQKDG